MNKLKYSLKLSLKISICLIRNAWDNISNKIKNITNVFLNFVKNSFSNVQPKKIHAKIKILQTKCQNKKNNSFF